MGRSDVKPLNHTRVRNVAFKGYKDGTVEFLGDQIEAMTGYSRLEFNSKAVVWTNLILEEDKQSTREAFVRALKGDKTYMREYRIRDKAGNIMWLQEWSQIVCAEDGSIDFVTGIVMDNTDNKQAELERLKCERRTGKYLTFSLLGQEYGINIRIVKEIIELMPVTPVPQAPDHIRGVVNLRGKVIPVMDLRLKFGMEASEQMDRSCIVVIENNLGGPALLTGMIVDSVSEVLFIKGGDIEDTPPLFSDVSSDYIVGLAKVDGAIKIILDMEKVLEAGDIAALAKAV